MGYGEIPSGKSVEVAREVSDKMLERRPVDTAGAADFAVKLILGGLPALPKL